MGVNTYDPRQVVVVFGATQLTGFSEDKLVEIKYMGKGIESVVGADGEVARSMDPDQRIECTVTLLQVSDTNGYLSDCWQLDTNTGAGMLPLMIKDLNGDTLVMCPRAWVKKPADAGFSKAAKEREWTILGGQTEFYIGGNS